MKIPKLSILNFTLAMIFCLIIVYGFNSAEDEEMEYLIVTLWPGNPSEIQISSQSNYEAFKIKMEDKSSVSPLLKKVQELQIEGWNVSQHSVGTVPSNYNVHTFLLNRKMKK